MVNSTFAVLKRKDFDTLLLHQEQLREMEMVKFLQGFPYFSHLTTQAVSKISYGIEKVEIEMGQTIIEEGKDLESVYFVKEGKF